MIMAAADHDKNQNSVQKSAGVVHPRQGCDVEIELESEYLKVMSDSGELTVHSAGQWLNVAKWLMEISKDGVETTILKLRTSKNQLERLQLLLSGKPVGVNREEFTDSLPLDMKLHSQYRDSILTTDNETRPIDKCTVAFLAMTMIVFFASYCVTMSVLSPNNSNNNNNSARWTVLLNSVVFICSMSCFMFLIRDFPDKPFPQMFLLCFLGSYGILVAGFMTEGWVVLVVGLFFLLLAAALGVCYSH